MILATTPHYMMLCGKDKLRHETFYTCLKNMLKFQLGISFNAKKTLNMKGLFKASFSLYMNVIQTHGIL